MSEKPSTKIFRAELLLVGIEGALQALRKGLQEQEPDTSFNKCVAGCLAESMKATEEASSILALVRKELMDGEIGVRGSK